MSGEFEVGQHRSYMDPLDPFDCLEFDHERIVYNEVHPVSALQSNALVDERQLLLSFHHEARLSELIVEARLVARFEETWSEFTMHPDRRADHRPGHIIGSHSVCSVCSVVSLPYEVCTAGHPEGMPGSDLFMRPGVL